MFSLLTLLAATAFAGNWNTKDGVAIDGYDVVAYHSTNEAHQGKSSHKLSWDGATWYFSSAANRDAFKAEPEKYAPAFGGYCAFAMAAKDAPVPVNPKQFKLYNGELLMFFDAPYEGKRMNTSIMWNADEEKMYALANKNWPGHDK